MNFRKYGYNATNAQTYDREKIFVTKRGQKYNVYDSIQAANIDTDIKEVLKKYHCTTDEALEIMKSRGGVTGIYADIVSLQEKAQDLPSLMKLKDYVQTEFEALPAEIKQKYGNNPEDFLKNAKAELEKQKQHSQQKTEEGGNKNAK